MTSTLTDADIAWMKAHASDNLKVSIIVCCAVCGAFSLLFIAARLWSRHLSGTRINLSDWLVITGGVLYLGLLATFVAIIPYGGGRHVIFLTNARMFAILMICNEILYCIVMGLIKLSLLVLYASIFPQRHFRWALWFTAFLLVSWVIYGCLTGIFQCVPVEALWDSSITDARCISYGTLVIAAGVHNILLDFIILALPIPMVWRLSMSTQKKRMLIFTFAMGGSAFIVSIVRQEYVGKVGTTADSTWDDMPAALVSVAELMAGFLAASIPTYRPLWRHVFSQSDKRTSYRTDGRQGSSSKNNSGVTSEDGPWTSNTKMQTKVSTGVSKPNSRVAHELGGISVTRDLELSTHQMPQRHRDDVWMRVSDDS